MVAKIANVLFVCSASWCPICQKQLIEINKAVSEIEARGYKLVALSYDKPEVLASFKAKRHIKYGFLSDPKSEIIDRYNLRDPQYAPNSFAYALQSRSFSLSIQMERSRASYSRKRIKRIRCVLRSKRVPGKSMP
jgi:peroxiredoxin